MRRTSSRRWTAFASLDAELERTRWELFRDGDQTDRFIEIFSVASWQEHLRQHEGRLTAADKEVEEAALAFSDPPARAEHLLPP